MGMSQKSNKNFFYLNKNFKIDFFLKIKIILKNSK